MYDRAALVGQCMIYGHSLKSNLVAIVVPDELAAASWAESKNISGTFEELCQRDDLKEEIMKQVCLHESFVLPSMGYVWGKGFRFHSFSQLFLSIC